MKPPRTSQFAKADRDLLRSDLSPAAKIVAIVIRGEMWNTGRASIGIRKLASETNYSTNTVLQAVKDIEESGVLVVERRGPRQRLWY